MLESSSYHALGACLRPYNAFEDGKLCRMNMGNNSICIAMNSRTASNLATGAIEIFEIHSCILSISLATRRVFVANDMVCSTNSILLIDQNDGSSSCIDSIMLKSAMASYDVLWCRKQLVLELEFDVLNECSMEVDLQHRM
ncbi:hypothetical protein Tco_1237760 [Tanacetum coccineum]